MRLLEIHLMFCPLRGAKKKVLALIFLTLINVVTEIGIEKILIHMW